MFKWNIIKRLIGIVLMFVGVYWGVIGLLVGMVISNWITYIINALLANKITGYSLLQQAVDVSPIFGISIVSSLITFFLGMLFSESYIEDLVVKVLIFVSCFILLCLLLKIKSFKLLVSIVSPYLTNISNKIKYN